MTSLNKILLYTAACTFYDTHRLVWELLIFIRHSNNLRAFVINYEHNLQQYLI